MKNSPVCRINDTRWEFLVIVNRKQGGEKNANSFWYMQHTTIFFILKDICKKRSIHEKLISWLVKRSREKHFFKENYQYFYLEAFSCLNYRFSMLGHAVRWRFFLGFFLAFKSISILCFLQSSLDCPNYPSNFLKLHPNYLYNLVFYIG